jgi:hypothetical protein
VTEFFTPFIATHSGILTSDSSNGPHGSAFGLLQNAPLPLADGEPPQARGFGTVLESHELSARTCLTSELLRFLQMMAASKPTS